MCVSVGVVFNYVVLKPEFFTFPNFRKTTPRPFFTFPNLRKVPPRSFFTFPNFGKVPPRPFFIFPNLRKVLPRPFFIFPNFRKVYFRLICPFRKLPKECRKRQSIIFRVIILLNLNHQQYQCLWYVHFQTKS